MGMRGELPTPRPDAIESPIPNAGLEQEELQQLVELDQPVSTTSNTSQVAEAEQEIDPELENPPMEQQAFDDIQRAPAGDPTFEEMQAELGITPTEKIKSVLEQQGFFQTLVDRMKVGTALEPGGSKKRALQIARRLYPDSEVSQDKKGEILIDGERFDKEDWEVADIADWSGDFIEAISSMLVEGGAIAGATAAGMPVAGVGGVVSGAIAYPIAAGAGAAAGINAREQAMIAEGGDALTDEERNAMVQEATLYNIAGMGVGKIFKSSFKGIKGLVGSFIESRPKNIITKLAVVHKGVDDMARKFGIPSTPKMAGEKVESVVVNLNKRLGKEVGLLKDELKQVSKGRNFIPEGYLKGTRELLEDQKVDFDNFGFATNVRGKSLTLESGNHGITALNQISEQYNRILGKIHDGNFGIEEMFDEAGSLAKGVDWDIQAGASKSALNRHFTDLSTMLASDKNIAAEQAAKGTKYEGLVKGIMGNFSNRAKDLADIRNLATNKESQELFMDALVNRENSERLIKLQSMLGGEGSRHWKEFKSSWFARKMEKSIDPGTGIFNANKFLSTVSDATLGGDTRKIMINNVDYGKLRVASRAFDETGVTEVLSKGGEQATKIIIGLNSPFRAAKMGAVKKILAGNAHAADYLLDRGFVEMAEKAESRAAKMNILGAKQFIEQWVGNSKMVKTIGGRTIYVTKPTVRNVARIKTRNKYHEEQGIPIEENRDPTFEEMQAELGL